MYVLAVIVVAACSGSPASIDQVASQGLQYLEAAPYIQFNNLELQNDDRPGSASFDRVGDFQIVRYVDGSHREDLLTKGKCYTYSDGSPPVHGDSLAGRWVLERDAGPCEGYSRAHLDMYTGNLQNRLTALKTGGTTTESGSQVVRLSDDLGSVYVTTSQPHRILRIESALPKLQWQMDIAYPTKLEFPPPANWIPAP
jgi:hypothetical protein